MKRTVSLLLCIFLFVSAFPLSGMSEGYIFTINGVRTAFFAEDGSYLPPVEENGIVFVAAVPLAGNLNLALAVDPEKCAVTLNGVRMAFFAEDGSLIEPLLVDGTLYVPLKAFAESAGINLTVDGNTYALSAGQDGPAASVPEPAAPAETYGLVPLTTLNYRDYFILSQSYYEPAGYPDPFYITYTLTIQASTGYDLVNAEFVVVNYGRIRIPASGKASASYRGTVVHGGDSTHESIMSIADEKTNALFTTARSPEVESVSGSIRMSRAEADRTNRALFEKAVALTLSSSISRLDTAIEVFEKLAAVNYPDSAEELAAAREQRKKLQEQEEKKAAEAQEAKNAELYTEAETALKEADYEKAISLFTGLSESGYRDSADRLAEAVSLKEEAEEQRNAARYLEAEEAETNGDLEKAVEIFLELKALEYRDSAARYTAARDALSSIRYEAGQTALQEGRYGEADALFEELAQLNYRDSVYQHQAAHIRWLIDEGKHSDALDYAASLPAGEQSRALFDECLFRCAVDVKAPNSAGNVWFKSAVRNRNTSGKTCWYLMSADGKLILEGIDEDSLSYYDGNGKEITGKRYVSAYGNKRTMPLEYYGDYALIEERHLFVDRDGKESRAPELADHFLADNLLSYKDRKSSKYGAMDTAGKTVIKPVSESALSYAYGFFRIHKRVTRKGQGIENQYGLIDMKGKTVIKLGQYESFTVLSENVIIVTAGKKGQSDIYLVDGKGRKIKNAPAVKGGRGCGGYILLADENYATGIWDKDLQPVIPPCFNTVLTVIPGRCVVGTLKRESDQGSRVTGSEKDGSYEMQYENDQVALFDMNGGRLTPEGAYCKMAANTKSACVAAKSTTDNAWHLLDLEGNVIY